MNNRKYLSYRKKLEIFIEKTKKDSNYYSTSKLDLINVFENKNEKKRAKIPNPISGF